LGELWGGNLGGVQQFEGAGYGEQGGEIPCIQNVNPHETWGIASF